MWFSSYLYREYTWRWWKVREGNRLDGLFSVPHTEALREEKTTHRTFAAMGGSLGVAERTGRVLVTGCVSPQRNIAGWQRETLGESPARQREGRGHGAAEGVGSDCRTNPHSSRLLELFQQQGLRPPSSSSCPLLLLLPSCTTAFTRPDRASV